LTRLLGERIQAGQDDGSISRSIDATLAAKMLIALSDGIQVQWLLDPDHTDMLGAFDVFVGNFSPARAPAIGDAQIASSIPAASRQRSSNRITAIVRLCGTIARSTCPAARLRPASSISHR
jgi:hypothetical protein